MSFVVREEEEKCGADKRHSEEEREIQPRAGATRQHQQDWQCSHAELIQAQTKTTRRRIKAQSYFFLIKKIDCFFLPDGKLIVFVFLGQGEYLLGQSHEQNRDRD